jgi:arylsulfatase A-like enzyme
MNRRALFSTLSAAALRSQTPPDRPNVLFYFPDQVRACDIGCYGGGHNAPTPNIDRLASQGVRFTNALSTFPLCTPYRAMLHTGRLPSQTGVMMNWVNLRSNGDSLADTFARAGYLTSFIGKWHLASGRETGRLKRDDPAPPPNRHSEFVPPGPARLGYQQWHAYNFHMEFARPYFYRDEPRRLLMPGYETDAETTIAREVMHGARANRQPFFVTVAPHPPHPPWRAEQTPPASLARIPRELQWRPNVKARRDSPTYDPRCYYGMLSNIDDNVGALLEYLEKNDLADNTIVVFTSDHGEMMASHGRYEKMVPYAEAIDVPLIIRWPKRFRPGQVIDALATPIDHFPTLTALCGLTPPAGLPGLNLFGPTHRDAALLMNYSSHWDFPETNTLWPEWRGVRTKQHTYVRWLNGAEELYDLVADPYQMRNLATLKAPPAPLARLRQRLTQLLAEAKDDFRPGDQYAAWFNAQRDIVRPPLP